MSRGWSEHARRDLRYAARSIRRYPLAALVAIVSLGAGIGATTATLMARNAIFHNPPPLYAHPEQLSRVLVHAPDRRASTVPAPIVRAWLERADVEVDDAEGGIAAAAGSRAIELRAGERLTSAPLQRVTPGLFALLGVPAAIGRTFDRAGDPADAQTAVIAHHVWQDLFGGRPDVIGQELIVDRERCTVIGVMPARFWVASMDTGVWRVLDLRSLGPDDRLEVMARARPGTAREAVASRLARDVAAVAPSLPLALRDLRVTARSIGGIPLARQVAPYVIWLLAAAVFFTLLIACTNVAVLMMAQWTMREQEAVVRASLGATRARLVSALLAESLLLACAGGALGVGVTFALRGLLVWRLGSSMPFDLSIDLVLLWQSIAIVLAAGILTGLGPALYETRRLYGAPGLSVRTHERVRQRFRHALVVFEIAVTGALLVVTGALVAGYGRTLSYDPGFDGRKVVTVSLRHDQGVPVETLLDRARRLPGVTQVAMANAVPLASSGPETIVAVDAAGSRTTRAERAIVTPDYFTMFGVALRRGRALDARDGASAARVALVNDLVASRLWPRGDDLGAQVWIDGVAHEIVGRVAARASMALSTPSAAVYLPLAQEATPPGRLELVVRTDGDARRLVAPLREALAGAHGASVLRVLTLRDVQIVAGEEILATAFPMVPLISTAILLAATGIYGVLAFATTRRAREIALRIALGASRRDVAWLVASQAVRLVLIGGLCGLGVTWLLTRLAQGAGGVFDGPGWQAFAAPGALLGAIALLAAWIPARRAVRLDPAVLLRES